MTSAASLYSSVIADVISSIRESFLDEAVDEAVLMELKGLWEQKLSASKTVEPPDKETTAVQGARAAATGAGSRPGGASSSGGPSSSAEADAAFSGSRAAAGHQQQHHQQQQPQQQQQLVITDPNRLVPVQITIPAQPGNPASHPKALTVHVPAHALQPGGQTSATLQQVLTQAITQALTLPEVDATRFLQNQINGAFRIPGSNYSMQR